MKKIYSVLFLMFFVFLSSSVHAQDYWKAYTGPSTGKIILDKSAQRASFPKDFKLFDLNLSPLKAKLFLAAGRSATQQSVVISLPNVDGGMEQFEVFEASNFEPALQDKFPDIRAFSGKGITDKSATLKLSIAPSGIQTMVFRTDKPNEFIEAYSQDHTTYAVFTSQREKGQSGWKCFTPDENQMIRSVTARNPVESNFTESSAGELKVIRLAQSCTGEYANFFGASTAGTAADQAIVLTAFNNTMARCNGVYEKDLALHLNLVANTNLVMFFNPATDPYATVTNPGAPPGSWNTNLQSTLTTIIGEANYDIGHLFGASGGGGNAGCIGCVCVNGQKGSGITSPATGSVNPSATFPPSGDGFDIDYVVHEIGHQLGAVHTFSFDAPQIGPASVEVGSGITIMAYAGIVSGANVAAHSVDYYHAYSINQIQTNLATKTCPVTTNITANNATPVVGALTAYTIPITTPFALTGTATDANAGDVLTYAWEQNDAATSTTTGINSLASPTKLVGPNFASFPVNTTGIRLFPRLQSILTGASTTSGTINAGDNVNIEALSSVARTLNFKLTVRDNSPYVSSGAGIKVGQTAIGSVAITVSSAVGPFLITTQNSAISYNAGSTQTVTWSVNGTTGAPTNTANVKISWSTDGGLTFPTVLAASTANDGTETFTVPGTLTTTARIKVEAIGNIYFDINNASITVTTPPVGFSFTTPAAANVTCAATTATTSTLATVSNGGYVTPITLTATSGVPTGATVTFGTNPVVPGNSSVVTLSNTGALAPGTYTITVTGVSGAITQTVPVTFIVQPGAAPNVTNPSNQIVCAPATATFTSGSTTTGATFQWQSAPSSTGTFTNIAGATSATYTTPATTAAMNGTVYHVIVTYQCGTATSTDATLTVNTTAVITTPPAAQAVCNGTSATFTVAATGISLTYQWQSAPASTGPWTNVTGGTGATTASYTTVVTTPSMNGTYYRAVVTSTCGGAVNSAGALLTVNTVATIGTQPTAQSACVPNTATFTVAATGTGLSYQWQVAAAATPTVFTDISGATSASYTTPATTFAMNGNVYRVNILSTCSPTTPTTSNTAVLTVNNPVSVTQNPIARSGCAGDNFTFSVTATSGGTISYQWQVSTNGGTTYTNITGATSATYTVAAPPVNFSGYLYRVIVSGVPCGLVTTPGAALTLSNRPQVVLTAANGSVNPISTNPGNPSGLYATVSPDPATVNYVFSWTRDGIVLPILSSSITPANGFLDAFGAYQVTVTDVSTGCTSKSNIVTVSDIPSQRDRLFVYPNPTRGIVHLSYYSSTVAAQSRMVMVYDGKGARVMQKAFAPVGTYGQMSLDLSGLNAGVYMVQLLDASGRKLGSEQIIKNN
jgi:hypothetical protein